MYIYIYNTSHSNLNGPIRIVFSSFACFSISQICKQNFNVKKASEKLKRFFISDLERIAFPEGPIDC